MQRLRSPSPLVPLISLCLPRTGPACRWVCGYPKRGAHLAYGRTPALAYANWYRLMYGNYS